MVPSLHGLWPDGLPAGRLVCCTGVAAASTAITITTEAVREGSWLAVVDTPWLGVEAVRALGLPLERLVRIDTSGRDATTWAEVIAAALDGFELVVTEPPRGVSASLLRRVHVRLRSRGAVLVTLGGDANVADATVHTTTRGWEHVTDGHGYLAARRVEVEVAGRRVPIPRVATLWLPDPTGGCRVLEPAPSTSLRAVG